MGGYTLWTEYCPKCKLHSVECYDAPSSLGWHRVCESCGWYDERCYFEAPGNIVKLCTTEEAKKDGLWSDCPKCSQIMLWWEKDKYGKCFICRQDDNL